MSEVDDSQTRTGWRAARGLGFKKWWLAGITKKPLTDANASFLYLNFKNTAKNTDSFILWRKYIELFQDI